MTQQNDIEKLRESKCPVCKGATGGYYWPATLSPKQLEWREFPLYQRSYPGEPTYISPRCSRCFDKAVKEDRRIFAKPILERSMGLLSL